jgi:hydroxymethylpyrimidine pyrophosphatase-like HAD family hydrolase
MAAGSLRLPCLLNDLERLAELLLACLERGDTVNAYLIAAGMDQVVADGLHPDRLRLARAAARLRRRLPASWAACAAAPAAAAALLWRLHLSAPGTAAAARWQADLGALLHRLGSRWVGGEGDGDEVGAARDLAARLPSLPERIRRDPLRPPSCFRSFDQSPEDLEMLADAFASRWPDRDRRLAVIGIRTSGCYLAPLLAAILRRLGYRRVAELTLRPGQRWLPGEARLLRGLADDGLALLIDDPPRTWGSIARAAGQLAALGLRREQVILVQATFAGQEPPAELAPHPSVLLPEPKWSVHRRLAPEAVADALGQLLGGQPGSVRLLARGPAGRGHRRALFEVETVAGGERQRQRIEARGVGLGYFGEHALAVADRLRGLVPEPLGIAAGILYEAWPATAGLCEPLSEADVGAVVDYVLARARALPLDRDPSPHLAYRGIDWRWAGEWFSGLFGRLAEPGRLVAHTVARRLLRNSHPVLTDGRTVLGAFTRNGDQVVKRDYDQGVFGSSDFASFDPVSDLALAAVSARHPDTGDRLRRAYEERSGTRVEPERWLLHQLAHVAASQARLSVPERLTDQRPARLLQRYYRETLVQPSDPGGGPLCALDLDGVLESSPMGFSATSPAGAIALRSLLRHGYRVALATGRSLAEVQDRCCAYGLAGGVAEYGAVVYLAPTRIRSLLDAEAAEELERLRRTLASTPGVYLDPRYRHSVRAFRVEGRGRRGLSHEQLAAVRTSVGRVRVVRGHYQTDFVASGVSKERALLALAHELGAAGERPFALAVGDTVSDLGMIRLARHGMAPSNADRGLRESRVKVLARPGPAGLAQAVALVIGHPPGGCKICRPPVAGGSTRLLLALLAVQDRRVMGRVLAGLRLAAGR